MKKLLHLVLGLGLAFSLLSLGSASSAQSSAGFAVIVHPSNPVSTMNRNDVSGMFLRRERRWPNGRTVDPVDQPLGSPVREAFSQAVHRRSATSVASFWRQQIFSGRSVPPAEQANDAATARYVASHPDAIGYVSASFGSPAVKVLQVSGL